MTTHDDRAQSLRDMTAPTTGKPMPVKPQARPYQPPELHEVGTLAKLKRVGFNFRDGIRYQNNPY